MTESIEQPGDYPGKTTPEIPGKPALSPEPEMPTRRGRPGRDIPDSPREPGREISEEPERPAGPEMPSRPTPKEDAPPVLS